MMKRVLLFLTTNIAVIAVIWIILSIFNVHRYLTPHGIDYRMLLIFAGIIGFAGAGISLLISKWIAKRAYNIHLLDKPRNDAENWLLSTIKQLAVRNKIGMPEVGIYESPEPNAFATGANRNKALVAVSTGLLSIMDKEEIEGVLGHEIAHVANGDMVTMALIQGVVNTFVIFFARVAAFFVMQFFRGNNENGQSPVGGFVYYGVAILFEILFGILASTIVMWFSRWREFRADSGSARIVGKDKMIKALRRLQAAVEMPEDNRAPAMDAMKISSRSKMIKLFSSHPPIADRIAALNAA